MVWEAALERLRGSINDSDRDAMNEALTCLRNLSVMTTFEIEALFGRLLMENGKTKYAKIIFERLLYYKKSDRRQR